MRDTFISQPKKRRRQEEPQDGGEDAS